MALLVLVLFSCSIFWYGGNRDNLSRYSWCREYECSTGYIHVQVSEPAVSLSGYNRRTDVASGHTPDYSGNDSSNTHMVDACYGDCPMVLRISIRNTGIRGGNGDTPGVGPASETINYGSAGVFRSWSVLLCL